WSLIEAPWTAAAFTAAIQSREDAYGPDRAPTVALSNHDRERQAGRLAASVGREADSDAIARAAAVLQFGLRGTPFLYYGEEIGMVDVVIPDDEIVDPPARLIGPDFPWYDRSRCRTPMQWTAGPGAGFTSGTPWLRIAPDTDARNVAAQRGDPGSVLETYRRLLAARRDSLALRVGRHDWIATGQRDVLAWSRTAGRERRLVVINFAGSDRDIVVETAGDAWMPVAGSQPDPAPVAQDGRLHLRADEAVIFRPATV
nr:alpha-amylase [Chloroflexota bacterium]